MMVPKVAGKGSSFKGAGLYYLHDKGADTAGRVAFTHTENLPTTDADKAVRCMAFTAMHQNEIKTRAGGSAKGRKLTKPVYAYSLAWHPDQEPTQQQMIEAAKETLSVLGLSGHEALFVSHNDEPHPHIHVIVNRVHPETGIAAPLSKDHLKLSRWAEAYEREHGQILCEQRVANNERRRGGEFTKDKTADIYDWRRKRLREDFERRLSQQQDLSEKQKKQQLDLYDTKERLIERERQELRAEHSRFWRALYLQQDHERLKLALAQEERAARLGSTLKGPGGKVLRRDDEERKSTLSGYFKDTATRTERETPEQQRKSEERNRKDAEAQRGAALGKLLDDRQALGRADAERKGKLAGHFSDRADPLPAARLRKELSPSHATHKSEREALDIKHARERKELGDKIREKQKANIKAISALYKEQLEVLKEEQARQRGDLAGSHSRQSQDTAREIREGRDIERFNKESGGYSAFRDMRDDSGRERDDDDDDGPGGSDPDRSRKGPGEDSGNER